MVFSTSLQFSTTLKRWLTCLLSSTTVQKWFRSIGPENSPGTKAFALTGNISNTGLIEVPMGTSLRKVIFDIGGGMRGDGKFKAVQIGGPSGGCLVTPNLDIQLDFDLAEKKSVL